jgi:hypothetical protein
MIRTFAEIVTSGQRQPRWGEQALATQQVLDALLCSARQDGSVVAVGGQRGPYGFSLDLGAVGSSVWPPCHSGATLRCSTSPTPR